MSFKKNIALLFLLGIAALTLHSCRAKKQIVAAAAPVEKKVEADLFADILNKQFNYSTFTARLNVGFTSGTRSLSSKASLKVAKDKALQISLQPLFGFEMLRIYVDTDSVLLIDRMNKRYVKEAIEDVKREYPVGFDFETLQSLFTNRIFVSGQSNVVASDYGKFFTEQVSDLNYLLKSVDKKSGIGYSFTIDGNDRIAFTHLVEGSNRYSLQWQYSDFALLQNQIFPHKMAVSVRAPKRKLDVDFDFSNIVLNEEVELFLSVPNGYTRATLSDIVKLLSGN